MVQGPRLAPGPYFVQLSAHFQSSREAIECTLEQMKYILRGWSSMCAVLKSSLRKRACSSTSRFHRGAQPRALEHHEEWRCCALQPGRAEATAARQPDKKSASIAEDTSHDLSVTAARCVWIKFQRFGRSLRDNRRQVSATVDDDVPR